VEPILQITKDSSPNHGDSGDTITFTVTITNPSATNDNKGFDVVWTDMSRGPDIQDRLSGVLGYVCTSHSDIDASSPDLTASWDAFPVGSVATVTYQATLDASVPSGTTYTNTAHVAGRACPGAIPRTHRRRSGAGLLHRQRPGRLKVNDATPTKAVLTTSETSTTTPDVTIGEVVTYELVVTVPEAPCPEPRSSTPCPPVWF